MTPIIPISWVFPNTQIGWRPPGIARAWSVRSVTPTRSTRDRSLGPSSLDLGNILSSLPRLPRLPKHILTPALFSLHCTLQRLQVPDPGIASESLGRNHPQGSRLENSLENDLCFQATGSIALRFLGDNCDLRWKITDRHSVLMRKPCHSPFRSRRCLAHPELLRDRGASRCSAPN